MSDESLQPGVGSRLPIIAGWYAYPQFSRVYYKDVESNANNLTIYETIRRPNGYFFAIPTPPKDDLALPWQGHAILCRTTYDTTSSGRPCVEYTALKRVLITVATHETPLEGEWVAEVPDSLPDDIASRIDQLKRTLAAWYDAQVLSAKSRKNIEETSDPVEFSHALCSALASSLPQTVCAQTMLTADVGERLDEIEAWMKAEISQDVTKALTSRFERLDIPPDVRQKLEVEISLLQYSHKGSSDYERLMTYLQFAASLPWGSQVTPPNLTLDAGRALLDKDHAGLDNVKKMVIDQLVTLLWWKRRRDLATVATPLTAPPLRNMLLVGPPGTGKTTLLTALAAALDRPVAIIPCGGISDIDALNGLERGYIGARVGAIMEAVTRAKTCDLVLGLDEIDKMGSSHRGDPFAVLLELTDPVRNTQFTDRYLQFPFDLSQVLVVATANTLDTIPSSLRDRFDIIELRGYSFHEKLHMARSYILPRLYKSLAITKEQIAITKPALACIIDEYTYESGVRWLTRTLLTLLQRALADLLTDDTRKSITPTVARRYLGTPTVVRNATPLKGKPGYGMILTIVSGTGMGDVSGMQVSLIGAGTGQQIFSGFGDDVGKESAQIALSYLKLHAGELGIAPSLFATHDLHIHYDEIAARKKGPSAGMALLLATLSALRDRSLPEKWAVTGEIALDGRVLAVGGVPEKIIAAHRAGVRTILIPAANQSNLADIPEDIRAALTIVLVATIDQAIALTFPREKTIPYELPTTEKVS